MARISKVDQERIRQKILDVASEKFQKDGFENVSTKTIAKEVGIAEGTLFNYFDSKTHLFLEVFSEQFSANSDKIYLEYDLTQDVRGLIVNHLESMMKLFLRVPKGILSELMIASIKLAKKHPKQFRKFVELDFQYMQDLEKFLDLLIEKEILYDVNTKDFSEVIYSNVMYEFIMYLYDESLDKDTLKQNIKTKIDVVLKGYLKGGQNEY